MNRPGTTTAIGALVSGLVALGIGVVPAESAQIGPSQDPLVATPLATTIQATSGTWATLPMGHLDQPINTFWQLFYRPVGSTLWSDQVEATATATNGGLVLASAPTQPFVVGVRPTNFLHFSPLIDTKDGARTWTNGVLPDGLATRPSALSIAPDGHALGLVSKGQATTVMTTSGSLSTWTTLTSTHQLAATSAARSCGVMSMTAVASLGSTPIVGAGCRLPGVVGIFEHHAGSWQRDAITLPASLRHDQISVLRIGQTPYGLAATLEGTQNGHSVLLGAWTTSNGWSVSPALSLPAGQRIDSIGPASGLGLFVLSATTSGATELGEISGPGDPWVQLPAPPPNTATIAFGAGASSPVDALAAANSTLTVWSLGSGSSTWTKGQVLAVKIEFGSSS
jgi:hypothetical protein